jgi:CheY-like chemotaxis protein/DNA-binding XRE family transcriptional regulator
VNAVDLFIGERILSSRKKRKLSQDELAQTLNISRQQLQKYETGITRVPLSVVADIGKALGVKISDLIQGIDEIKYFQSESSIDAFVTTTRTTSLNVLLVEDNATDELLTRKAIAQCEQACNIVSVCDGVAALEYLRNGIKGINTTPMPDIILLDLNVPRMRGDETLKSIKSGSFQHIPVIIVTNSITREEMLKVYRLGASGFVVKTFAPEEYFEKISSIISYWSMMVLPSM